MSADLVSVPLYRLGHGRSGDKGDISNLSLIAWDPECYAILAAQVSEAAWRPGSPAAIRAAWSATCCPPCTR